MNYHYYRLSKDYYKGKDSRTTTEGMNSKGWWFTGGKSFMSNGYVIYKNGLDGNPPNPTAMLQGFEYNRRLFDYRSMDSRASYGQFIEYLVSIKDQAAENEHRYLKLKLDQLRENSEIDISYLDKIEEALLQEDYNAAYTLLLKRDKDLKEFKREVQSNHNKSFSKTNEFFNNQFYSYIADIFEQQLENQSGDTRTFDLDTDFESLVNGFLEKTLGTKAVESMLLDNIKQTFIDGLEKLAAENGGKINLTTTLKQSGDMEKVFRSGFHKKVPRDAVVKKDGDYRTPGELARRVAYALMKNIGMGLSSEVIAIGAQQNIGMHAASTGSLLGNRINEFTKDIYAKNVAIKNDLVSFDAFGVEIDFEKIIKEAFDISRTGEEFFQIIEEKVKEAAENSNGEFFEFVTNVKGYMSNYDLQIEGTGNFSDRMSVIKRLNLGGNMTDKLIFMLNNTTKKCMMEDRISEIQDYLATVCVAWMWDNSEDIFDLDLKQPNNYHKIYLFDSGGAYFTASQIIDQTIDRLVNEGIGNKFVKVGIIPPAEYGDYTNLCNKYSVNGVTDKDTWQSILKQRWDEVRNTAMQTGALSIHFDQKELNELLGNLKNILEQS